MMRLKKKKYNNNEMKHVYISHTTKMDMGLHGMRWKIRLNHRETKNFQFSLVLHAPMLVCSLSFMARSSFGGALFTLYHPLRFAFLLPTFGGCCCCCSFSISLAFAHTLTMGHTHFPKEKKQKKKPNNNNDTHLMRRASKWSR